MKTNVPAKAVAQILGLKDEIITNLYKVCNYLFGEVNSHFPEMAENFNKSVGCSACLTR
jgi:hypothetical protein